jgi:hypothetical protein
MLNGISPLDYRESPDRMSHVTTSEKLNTMSAAGSPVACGLGWSSHINPSQVAGDLPALPFPTSSPTPSGATSDKYPLYGRVECPLCCVPPSYPLGIRKSPIRNSTIALLSLLFLSGCGSDKNESWRASTPGVIHESNGFRFGFYGPRESGYAPDGELALTANAVTVEEIGLALELRAIELAIRTGSDAISTVATLRGCVIWIVDDYSFEVGNVWAAGLREGSTIYVSLWLRAEVSIEADIPLDAPAWTIRPPANGAGWRYGSGARLVPAADHELGHVLFGPYFEH